MSTCTCANTLAELGTIPIFGGLQIATVQQFEVGSALSGALYILVTANPGHPLSIQANGSSTQWWTIHPDYVSLEAAGAPPPGGDCAPAMQNLIRYWVAIGRMKLNLWERDYILNSLTGTSSMGLTVPSNSGLPSSDAAKVCRGLLFLIRRTPAARWRSYSPTPAASS